MGQVSLPCNMHLCTQLRYNLPFTVNDISLLVSNGTNCLTLFHPIQILFSTATSAFPFTLSTHTHTHTHTKVYGSLDFVWDNPGEPALEETFAHSHLSWSSIVPDLLHPSSMIHGILCVQFMHPTVFFHNLSPTFPWSTSCPSTSCSIHFFTQSLSSLRNTGPYHHNLFCCSTEIMSSNPGLSTLYLELCLVTSCHTSI